MKGKHAARAENRRQHALEADVVALRGDVGQLKDLLEQAERRVRYVESLEKELAFYKERYDDDKLLAESLDEIDRLRKISDEWDEDYRAVLDDAGTIAIEAGRLLGWTPAERQDFFQKHCPRMLPGNVRPGSASRIGVSNISLDDEAVRRIQLARGLRKASTC